MLPLVYKVCGLSTTPQRVKCCVSSESALFAKTKLRSSIKGLVTEGNTKLYCRGFVLALFISTTANKIDSEHTNDYTKLFPVCKVEILQVTVNKIEVLPSF